MLYYLLKSSLLLALLYGAFSVLLGKETFHRFNRMVLIVILLASVFLPMVEITLNKPAMLSSISSMTISHLPEEGLYTTEFMQTMPLPKDEEQTLPQTTPLAQSSEENIRYKDMLFYLPALLPWVYIIGVTWRIGVILWQLLCFIHGLRKGVRHKDEYGNTIVIRGVDIAAFSFLRYIVISARDYERFRNPILAHEQAHIRLGHSWDILLSEIICALQWFNPFAYMLGRDLRAVHEYEADSAVLDTGIDASTYQRLLVIKAVGTRLQSLTNCLNHGSLKNRIIMMNKKKTTRLFMLKGLFLPLFMGIALVAFAKPKISEGTQLEISTDTYKSSVTTEQVKKETEQNDSKKMVVVRDFLNERLHTVRRHRVAFIVRWNKGTWIDHWETPYVEDRPESKYGYFYPAHVTRMFLDGVEFDSNNVPNLPSGKAACV